MSVVLAPRGEVAGNSRVGMGVARIREERRTVGVPLGGLLDKPAGAAAQLTTRKTNAVRMRRKRPRMVAGGRVVLVRQRSCAKWLFSAGCELWRGRASRNRDAGACRPDSLAAAVVAATRV